MHPIEQSTSSKQLASPNLIAVFGAGAFGQALASAALQSGNDVLMFAPRQVDFASAKKNAHLNIENPNCRFVSMAEEADSLSPKSHAAPSLIVMAVPCQALRQAAGWLAREWRYSLPPEVVVASKGVEQSTLLLPHQVLESVLPACSKVGVISGPSFASELVKGSPTSVVCASSDEQFVRKCSRILHRPNFRIYGSRDIVGVEVGGALKNVVAMVAGAVDGLGLGNNARAAVITRGLGEITQVGVALGADPMTFLGLSGLGDLVLTCTGDLSRNRSFGMQLAKGLKPQEIMQALGEVVEGYTTAQSAFELSQKLGLDTPIIDVVHKVLYEDLPVREALVTLMQREQKEEFEWAKN